MGTLHSWQAALDAPNLVWAPRLTAGIYAVARVVNAKTVVVPNICCQAVVYGIVLAGARPAFCDVDLQSGALNSAACENLLINTNADMVLHVHPFGFYSDPHIIYQQCQRHGAFFFEDGASWFPPTPGYEVHAAGCLGLSFGWQKIFDLGGGSLLAFGDAKLAEEIAKCLRLLPPGEDMRSEFEAQFYSMEADKREGKSATIDFSVFADRFKRHWIGNRQYSVHALSAERIQRERYRRLDIGDTLSDILSGYPIQLLKRSALDFPWRLSFLSKDTRFVENMFYRNNFVVSRLYPALNRYFPNFPHSDELTNSYRFADQIYNVDISANVTNDRIRLAARRYLRNALTRRVRVVVRTLKRRLAPLP